MGATLSSLCSTPAEMDTVDGNDFTYLTFCYRVHAIDILNEVRIGSASDADNTQWKQISDRILKYDVEMSDQTLKELREELENSRDSANSSIFERIRIVSDAFDTGLLSYLQDKVHLMEKLQDFLPNQGQSWEEFVMDRQEESILQNVQPNALYKEDLILQNVQSNTLYKEDLILRDLKPNAGQEVLETFKNRTRILMSAIEGVDEDVKKSGVSQSVQKENKIKVFYATNRDWSDGSYTPNPGKRLLYGFQKVRIPGDHERGKVESPNKSGQGNDSEHFMLKAKKGPWLNPNEFLDEIKEKCDLECAQNGHSANKVASSSGGPQKIAREVLLYIHGYAVSYNRALMQAAQLKNDLKFEGLVILYSWPTMGQRLAYYRDGRVIKSAAHFLREFILIILREVSFSEVHILAHSMGNRALIEALTMPLSKPRRYKEQFKELVHQRGVLKNVILAAADETLRKFEDMLPKVNSIHCPLISVYSSASDWPLFVSGYINWQLRLGNTVSLFDKPSMQRWDRMVDVIDASGVRCGSWLKHSYHAEATEVLDDMQKLLTEKKRAGERPVIEPLLHDSGQVFHAFQSSWWEQRRFKGRIRKNRKSSSSNQGHG